MHQKQAVNNIAGLYATLTSGADNGNTAGVLWMKFDPTHRRAAVVRMDANNNLTTDEYVAQGQFPTPQTGTMTCGPAKLPCSRWGHFTATYNDVLTANFSWGASMYMTNANQRRTTIASGSAS